MTVHEINPLEDSRWTEFLLRHPRASVFHSSAWLKLLKSTYGFTPVVYTTSAPGFPLQNCLAFCTAGSWATRSRLVSLPFSDDCETLVDDPEILQVMLQKLILRNEGYVKYIELRPVQEGQYQQAGFFPTEKFLTHSIDLRPTVEDIFQRLHKTERQSTRIAQRKGIQFVADNSEKSLKAFYDLVLQTRQRHALPPQPMKWYRNLLMAGETVLTLAYKSDRAVGGTLGLRFKSSLVCKYICSDYEFRNEGVVPALLWKNIQDAKMTGCLTFNLGRTEIKNEGLARFKRRFGSSETEIQYWQYPKKATSINDGWQMTLAKRVFAHMPRSMLTMAGSLLYKHIA